MILSVLAAATLQTAAAPAPQTPTRPDLHQLACPAAKGLQAKSVATLPKVAPHTLNQEPDAAMIRPVARTYCEEADVVRYSVTPGQAQPRPSPLGR